MNLNRRFKKHVYIAKITFRGIIVLSNSCATDSRFDTTTTVKFGFFLKEYISRLQLKNKDFAQQIGIEPAELSQLLNAHRKPNDKILVRLELHSGKNINSPLWYRILVKDKEYELLHNDALRQEEKEYVHAFFEEDS